MLSRAASPSQFCEPLDCRSTREHRCCQLQAFRSAAAGVPRPKRTVEPFDSVPTKKTRALRRNRKPKVEPRLSLQNFLPSELGANLLG